MMNRKIRAPFPWFGGKGSPKIKKALLTALPPHRFYVEPFGGGASILLAKTPAEVEVYNDVNRGVVNFFRGDRITGLFRAVHGSSKGAAVFARVVRGIPAHLAGDP